MSSPETVPEKCRRCGLPTSGNNKCPCAVPLTRSSVESAITTLVTELTQKAPEPGAGWRELPGVNCKDCEAVAIRLREKGIKAAGFCYKCAVRIYKLPHGLPAYGL